MHDAWLACMQDFSLGKPVRCLHAPRAAHAGFRAQGCHKLQTHCTAQDLCNGPLDMHVLGALLLF